MLSLIAICNAASRNSFVLLKKEIRMLPTQVQNTPNNNSHRVHNARSWVLTGVGVTSATLANFTPEGATKSSLGLGGLYFLFMALLESGKGTHPDVDKKARQLQIIVTATVLLTGLALYSISASQSSLDPK